MFNIFSVFTRSALYANLTPGERAFLRFVSVLLGGAFLAGAQAIMPLLNAVNPLDPASVPWASVGHTFLAAFALAIWLGIGKYRSAQGDPPLPFQSPAPTQSAQTPAPQPVAAPVAAATQTPTPPPASSLVAAPVAAPVAPPVAG